MITVDLIAIANESFELYLANTYISINVIMMVVFHFYERMHFKMQSSIYDLTLTSKSTWLPLYIYIYIY